MKILQLYYNDTYDERAIRDGFRSLGHKVTYKADLEIRNNWAYQHDWDFIFFNHYGKVNVPLKTPNTLKVFWCFDLISQPLLHIDQHRRKEQINELAYYCDLVFHTDGDWVEECSYWSKAHWLMQEAPECVMYGSEPEFDVLFAGTVYHERQELLRELSRRFDTRVVTGKDKVYEHEYAKLISKAKVVVAPDTPVGPKYWSNRAFMVPGYGGFLLHPHTPQFDSFYQFNEVPVYDDRESLFYSISDFLRNTHTRDEFRFNAFNKTIEEHTYKHRCEVIINKVQEKLGATTNA